MAFGRKTSLRWKGSVNGKFGEELGHYVQNVIELGQRVVEEIGKEVVLGNGRRYHRVGRKEVPAWNS